MTQVLRGAPRMIPPMVPVVSKSAAKEPAARSGHGQNRGIMRFSLARSRLTEAFAADMDIPRSGGARKALSVEEACGGAAGGVGELVGGGQEGGVSANYQDRKSVV